ncbi:MAG TPA: hypothetical protein VK699_05430 [Terriglobales bacterium]|jgi:hypothetical protein|nr:hypothetical protein [Terriglobales bacterium]
MKKLLEIFLLCSLGLTNVRGQNAPRYQYHFAGPVLTLPGFLPEKASESHPCNRPNFVPNIDRAASCFAGSVTQDLNQAVRELYRENPRRFRKHYLHKPMLIVTVTDAETRTTKRVRFTAERYEGKVYVAIVLPDKARLLLGEGF